MGIVWALFSLGCLYTLAVELSRSKYNGDEHPKTLYDYCQKAIHKFKWFHGGARVFYYVLSLIVTPLFIGFIFIPLTLVVALLDGLVWLFKYIVLPPNQNQ